MSLSLGAEGISYLEPHHWETTLSYRYLHAQKVFIGSQYRPEYEAGNANPDITVHSVDLAATYAVSKRFSLSLTLPFVYGDVTVISNRLHNTVAGIGDLRLVGNIWLLDPSKHSNGNISFGLGMKAPTGESKGTDTVLINGVETVRPADTSIQPGDGGWGVVLEMQGFQKIVQHTYLYASGFYLINPREKNDTQFTTDPSVLLSVPDQYQGRLGLSYTIWPQKGISLSLGARVDGLPVRDLIGGADDGFRRPGYSVYIDPGISWSWGKNLLSLNGPVAVARSRQRSIRDIQASERTGNYVHGAGGIADFILVASYSRRF
ncbi:MAG: hypothetical protein HYY23_13575 [Verrucomicrobia bacterium]|nr:hypothetical protein [Verrucomicrobiota bacterium]